MLSECEMNAVLLGRQKIHRSKWKVHARQCKCGIKGQNPRWWISSLGSHPNSAINSCVNLNRLLPLFGPCQPRHPSFHVCQIQGLTKDFWKLFQKEVQRWQIPKGWAAKVCVNSLHSQSQTLNFPPLEGGLSPQDDSSSFLAIRNWWASSGENLSKFLPQRASHQYFV